MADTVWPDHPMPGDQGFYQWQADSADAGQAGLEHVATPHVEALGDLSDVDTVTAVTGIASAALGGIATAIALIGDEWRKVSVSVPDDAGLASWKGIRVLTGAGIDPTGMTDSASALQALVAAGGRFYLPGGTYLLSTTLTLPSNTEINGAGWASVLKLANGSTAAITYNAGGSNIRLRDLLFDGGTQSTATNSVLFDGSTDVTVERCRLRNMKTAIWLNNNAGTPARVTIRDNHFESCVDFGVRALDGVAADVRCEDNYVAGVTGSNVPVAFRYSGTGGVFRNNRIASTADTGIMLVGTANCVIDGNVVNSTLVSVFVGTGAKRTKVANNNLSSAQDFGLHLADSTQTKSEATVTGNVIHDCGKSGISCEGVESISITGNTLLRVGKTGTQDNWKSGIVVTANAGVNCAKVTIVGNVIRDDATSPTMKYGVFRETACPDVRIASNIVSGATAAPYQTVAPTIAVAAGVGAGATATIAGTDSAGLIQINVGTSPSAGVLATVTFSSPLSVAPRGIFLQPANPPMLSPAEPASLNATTWQVTGNPTASTTYYFYYHVLTD